MSAKAMKWASAVSLRSETEAALDDVFEQVNTGLNGATPDIAFVFVSPQHKPRYETVNSALVHELRPRHILGCSGGGIIGGAREIEQAPALSLTAAVLPDVAISTFHLEDEQLPDLDASPRKWEELVRVHASENPHFILLPDPFSMGRADDLLNGLDFAFPKSVKIGGLASGGMGTGQNALYLDGQIHRTGTVGLSLTGALSVDTLVAQGCRPIGKPMQITRCMRNLLIEVDKKPALETVQELYDSSTEREQELIRSALFLGIVMDPFKTTAPQPGDFLIRNVIGSDNQHGVLAIGALLNEGQTVQFHLREVSAASEDLHAVLSRCNSQRMDAAKGEAVPEPPRGALLFSCLGRGKSLYRKANHDSDALTAEFGPVPLGGFFCNGEIGPVNGTTYIHGFTSCFALFNGPAATASAQ